MGDVEVKLSQWSVAWICSFILFLLLGVARLSGLLYLAAIGRYNADRSQASLPFVLCYTVRNVSGPLIGYMGRKVEIRLLIASGCFLSAVGAGVCFFAEDITTVSILWGGVFGAGFGLGSILIPEVLSQHFDKYISNANGIALGGECVAGFVLPIFVEFLLDTYGTSGTFLILSGLILHGVPAALLLKSPLKTPLGSRISQSECSRNVIGGKYSPVMSIPDESFNRRNTSDSHAVKGDHEMIMNGREYTDYHVDYLKAKAGNSELFKHSESDSVTDPLVQSRRSTLLNEDYEASRTPIHNKKCFCHECLIASENVQPPTSHITTNNCNCNHCCVFSTSLNHSNENLDSRNCAASANQSQISGEKQPCQQSSLHCSTLNECSAIVPSCTHSNEESSNHFHDIQSTVSATIDHNHSYTITPQNPYLTNLDSLPCTQSSNDSKESFGHASPTINDESSHHSHDIQTTVPTTADHNHIYTTVSPHVYSITNSSSVPSTESTNQPKESPGHSSPFCVFLDPTFILILFTQSSMIFIFTTIMTIIVDFARDAGVKAHQEVYILMCLSVSDMLGRFGLGWVTDAKYMGNVSFSAVCYAGSGLLMVALVFLRGFTMVMVVAFLIGLLLGGLLIVCPGIVLDYIEKEEVTMALASRFVLYAPMSLTQSLLIGFFREKLGSYDGLFYVLAVHCFICCAFSLFIPVASRCRGSLKRTKQS